MKAIKSNYLLNRFFNSDSRTKKTHKNTIYGLIIKGGSMLISLILVPMTIDYLDKKVYGTWLTINSLATMLTFFDIGIGNGLRNKLSEAVAKGNILLAKSYVSTAYFVFTIIQLILLVFLFFVFYIVKKQSFYSLRIFGKEQEIVILITSVSIIVKLLLDVISYVLFALQRSSVVNLLIFLSNLLILLCVLLLKEYTHSSLVYLAIASSVSPIIVLCIGSVTLYKTSLKIYRPSFKLIDGKHVNSLLSIGYKFFLIQIAVVILFYTDNVIINWLFGSSEVTTYNISFRYFNVLSVVFNIAIAPYWSAFTDAYTQNDIQWIKGSFNRLYRFWAILVLGTIFLILIANEIYAVWLGNRVEVPLTLNICMGIFVIISAWNNIMVSVANGLGKIQMQLYYAILAAVINIPLSIILGKYLNLGSIGVILSTCVCLLIGTVFGTIQARKILSGNADGIWNK